jgi:hypothetical protein
VTEENMRFEVTESGANAGGVESEFTLYKTDNAEAFPSFLPGATFALYVNRNWGTPNPPPGVSSKIERGDDERGGSGWYYYLTSRTTDSNGYALFDSSHILTGDTFLLVETQAPPGYNMLGEPLVLYVMIDEEDEATPDADFRIGGDNGNEIYVANEPGVRFPETGGVGAGPYTAAGAAAMALVCLAFALLRVARTRRRRSFDDSA